MAETLPLYLTASFLTKQPNAGLPAGPGVFDSLANPPQTGVAAEEAADAAAEALGVDQPNSTARDDRYRSRDHVRDLYDSASILRVPAE